MASIRDLQNKYIEILENHLTDPNTDRRQLNKPWIHKDLPKNSISNKEYPRISVIPENIGVEPHALNSRDERVEARISIQVRVKRGLDYNRGSPDRYNEFDLLEDVTSDIISTFKEKDTHNKLNDDLCVFYVFREGENTITSGEVLVRELTYRNIMVR